MHGLVNRAIEEFTRKTYGDALWVASAVSTGIEPRSLLLMSGYEDALTGRLMREVSGRLARSPRDLAEDIGAWVARIPSIRRLLRFSAPDFHGFLMALPELNGRAAMVVRGFDLPRITLCPTPEGWEVLAECERIWLYALSGMLHAMADDYGVLAVVEIVGDRIRVSIPLTDFTPGRPFSISDPTVGAQA